MQCSADFPESQTVFDDSSWHSSKQPEQMAFFGNGHGRAWYRTKFKVTHTGPQMIYFSGAADRALVWVDGNYVGIRGVHSRLGWNVMPFLEKGEHVISILVENLGMVNSGAEFDIPLCEPKGIFGPVWLNGSEIRNWRMRAGTAENETVDVWKNPGPCTRKWENLNSSDLKGPVWIRGTLKFDEIPDAAMRLEFGENAGKGSVWINGFNIGRYWSLGPQQSLWIPCELLQKMNEVVILEEMKIVPAKIRLDIKPFGHVSEITL